MTAIPVTNASIPDATAGTQPTGPAADDGGLGPLPDGQPAQPQGDAATGESFLAEELIEPSSPSWSRWAIGGGIATALTGLAMLVTRGKAAGPLAKIGMGTLATLGLGTAGTGIAAHNRQRGVEEGMRLGQQEFQQEWMPEVQGLITQLAMEVEQARAGQVPGGSDGADDTSGDSGSLTGLPPSGGVAPEVPAGSWTAQSIIGQGVAVDAAVDPESGLQVAGGGFMRLESVIGLSEGYADYAQAMQAALATMSSDTPGSRDLRWAVIEQDGRFYAYQASVAADQAPQVMPAANGTLAGYASISLVEAQDSMAWVTNQWTRTGGNHFTVHTGPGVSGATLQVVPLGAAVTEGTPGTTPGGTIDGAGPTTPGQAPAFTPASDVTRGTILPVITTPTGGIDGGHVQLTAVLTGTGVATADEAVAAARTARDSGPANRWARFVVTQGPDGMWHAYAASVVGAGVPGMAAANQVAFVLGFDTAGRAVSMHHDGAAWQATEG